MIQMNPQSATSIQPMTLGRLLDRSIRLTPNVFLKFLPFYITLAVLQVGQEIGKDHNELALTGIAVILQLILGIPLYYGSVFFAGDTWLGKNPTAIQCIKRVTVGLVFRSFLFFLRVGAVGFLLPAILVGIAVATGQIILMIAAGCTFLLGIIYFLYRWLGYYALILDGLSVKESLTKSKQLMSGESWYRLTSPFMRLTGITILFSVMWLTPILLLGVIVGVGEEVAGETAVLSLIVFFLIALYNQIMSVLGQVCYSGFYYDLRARYEGSDIMSGLESLTQERN